MSHLPNPQIPNGTTSFGWEEFRVGPGGASILFDTQAHGELGAFTDISADSFAYIIEMGLSSGDLT